jgi:GDP-L-fucose synthase
MKKALVLGGSGFVGINLINALVNNNFKVTGTYHKKKIFYRNPKAKYKKSDLRNLNSCINLFRGMDYVFMCAANTSGAAIMKKNPLVHLNDNVIMNNNSLNSAYQNKVKKFIFISSSVVYPVTKNAVSENDVNDIFFEKYHIAASMKRFAEKTCYIYSNKLNKPMKTLIIRPGNLYGDFDKFDLEKSHVIPALIKKIDKSSKFLNVWGDGKDIKNFIYIKDFVDGVILATKSNLQVVNIANNNSCTLNEIIKHLLIIFKKKLLIKNDLTKPSMIPVRKISINLAKKKLKFKNKYSLKEGLKKTVEWYKSNQPLV